MKIYDNTLKQNVMFYKEDIIKYVKKIFNQRKEDAKKYITWQKNYADLVFNIKPIKTINYKDYNKNIDCPLSIKIFFT